MKLKSHKEDKSSDKKDKQKETAKHENLGDMRYVLLDHIVDHEEIKNRSLDKDHVQLLSESIGRDGLDVPLLVWPGSEDPDTQMEVGGKNVPGSFLIAGFHRRAALRKFRKADKAAFEKKFPGGKIPVKFIQGGLVDALAAQLRENLARENPIAADILPFVLRLAKEHKLKGKAIAKRIGKSEAWVSNVLAIDAELGEEATAEVLKGGVGMDDAIAAARKMRKNKKDKKKGKAVEDLDPKEALNAAKEKKKKKGKGNRAKKRLSLAALYARYKALPGMKLGAQKQLLEELIEYALGDSDKIPELLQADDEQDDKSEKKKKGKK